MKPDLHLKLEIIRLTHNLLTSNIHDPATDMYTGLWNNSEKEYLKSVIISTLTEITKPQTN